MPEADKFQIPSTTIGEEWSAFCDSILTPQGHDKEGIECLKEIFWSGAFSMHCLFKAMIMKVANKEATGKDLAKLTNSTEREITDYYGHLKREEIARSGAK